MASAIPLEEQSVDDICDYLEDKGFAESLIENFKGEQVYQLLIKLPSVFLFLDNEMDGAAIAAGLASTPCASWLKEVIPFKAGLRLKVHSALKSLSLQGSNQVRIFIMYVFNSRFFVACTWLLKYV